MAAAAIRPLVAGNWKMNGLAASMAELNAMKAGAADYIIKPFRNHDLLERTATVLRSRHLELHNRELLAERDRHLH